MRIFYFISTLFPLFSFWLNECSHPEGNQSCYGLFYCKLWFLNSWKYNHIKFREQCEELKVNSFLHGQKAGAFPSTPQFFSWTKETMNHLHKPHSQQSGHSPTNSHLEVSRRLFNYINNYITLINYINYINKLDGLAEILKITMW